MSEAMMLERGAKLRSKLQEAEPKARMGRLQDAAKVYEDCAYLAHLLEASCYSRVTRLRGGQL